VAFADVFYRRLIFNGKSALENGHDYQEIFLDSKEGSSTGQVVHQVLEAQPTIIVSVTAISTDLVQAIEAGLPRGATPPTYLLVNNTTGTLATFIGSNIERRRRVLVVAGVSNSTPVARFVIRYNQARQPSITRDMNPSPSYDAFYLLAYSSFGLPQGTAVSGVGLARGFSQLVGPGKSIEAGPTGIFDALAILAGGGTIDLDGIFTSLDFDLSTGETPSDFAILCPAIDDHGRANGEDIESGIVYHPKMRRSEGALKCP
jgi:hypothetical protein